MICVQCRKETPEYGEFCCCSGHQLAEKQKYPFYTLGQAFYNWKLFHYPHIGTKGKESYDLAWKRLSVYEDVPMTQLYTEHYQRVLNDNYANASRSSQEKYQQLCGQLCKFAMAHNLINVNYAQFLILNGYVGERREIFDDEKILRLVNYAESKLNNDWRTARIILCLIFSGYRPEEFFSLKRENVFPKEGYMIAGSKTAAGKNRMVPIARVVKKYILEWYLSTSAGDYLVRNADGGRMNLTNFRIRKVYPLFAELGFNDPYFVGIKDYKPKYLIYCTRHTFASFSHRAGIKDEILIKMIGHTNFEFTSKTYIHNRLEEYQDEMHKVDDLLNTIALEIK